MRLPLALLAALLLAATACEREERETRADPVATESPEQDLRLVELQPGVPNPAPPSAVGRRYEENAYHVSEGKRLYQWFNCVGCHANGGGGMGPPLMDDTWIYGGEIQNIAATILQGRPNGMPSFRGRIPEDQVWQLAAYIRSMPRYVRKDVAPGRSDDMNARPAENTMPRSAPVAGGSVPPSAARPQ
jgi:cytochrome c oxidase cbb3-type subunit III